MMQKDNDILREMRKGKRLNISEIARRLKIPVSTASDRMKAIEKKYLIKHSPIIDYPKLGYYAHAKLAVRAMPEKRPEFSGFLKGEDCVNSIYHVNSGFDFLVEVVFRNSADMKQWVESAKERFGLDILTFQILKVEQKEGFMPK